MKYEIPFRPAYEIYAVVGWALGILFCFAVLVWGSLPSVPFYAWASICVMVGLVRGWQSYSRIRELRGLGKSKLEFVSFKTLLKKARKHADGVWIGSGFEWTPVELQKAMQILKTGSRQILRKMTGNYVWIHNLGKQRDLTANLKSLSTHTMILGTTGSGKTRLYDLFISQAIARGETVIVLDPKGDKDLKENMEKACSAMGDPGRFVFFHPAFPESSARIDPLRNWNTPTELASRIASLMATEADMNPFKSFAWSAINNITNGLLLIDERPNLKTLRRYIEGKPHSLVERALLAHFSKNIPNWEKQSKAYLGNKKRADIETYIAYYQGEVINRFPSSALDGLIASYEHDRTHYQKMVASLIPILAMLTSGPLGDLLSPEPDPSDPRPITDPAKIIEKGQVVYIGLDTLSNNMVGTALGSILLADLAAVAGDRYNYGDKNRPVNLFADEAAEIFNKPTVQMLNKSRGAGFRVFLATQTISDFVARTRSQAEAMQAVANMNNIIALRVIDPETQEFLAKAFPTGFYSDLEVNYRSGTSSANPSEFSGMYSESLTEKEVPMVPSVLFGNIPDLHFFAKMADGTVLKGKLPILVHD